jgi:hypothetical protein
MKCAGSGSDMDSVEFHHGEKSKSIKTRCSISGKEKM